MTGPLRAALWMTGAVACFSMLAVAGRELAGALSTFQIMFWRSVFGAILITALVLASRQGLAQLRSARAGLHLGRNLAHFAGQNCWLYAVAVIPLAQVFALEFTTPIWVALLAPLVLGERFTGVKALSAALGFIGVLMVVRPTLDGLSLGQAVALAAAVFFAANVLATKMLSGSETTLNILFWMTVTQGVMSAAAAYGIDGAWRGVEALPMPTAHTAPWLLAVALTGVGAHFCMTSAFRHAEASVVSPMDFFRLPVIAVVGASLYGEALDPMVFLGGVLIFCGNFLNVRAASRPAPARALSTTPPPAPRTDPKRESVP